MDQATWDTIVQYLPWVLLGVTLLALYDMWRDNWHKKVQSVSHQFAKMGSEVITKLLDAIARSDRPAIVSTLDTIIDRYSGERGALLFGYEVFDFWIDDALNDPEYADKVGRRLEKEILGKVITEEQQIQLGKVAGNFGQFGLKSTQLFFQGLATAKIGPVRDAIRDIVNRFSDPDQVDDELVKLAPGIVQRIKIAHPEHVPALKELLLTLEEKAAVAKVA